jgi:hypothetical protein
MTLTLTEPLPRGVILKMDVSLPKPYGRYFGNMNIRGLVGPLGIDKQYLFDLRNLPKNLHSLTLHEPTGLPIRFPDILSHVNLRSLTINCRSLVFGLHLPILPEVLEHLCLKGYFNEQVSTGNCQKT